MTAKSITQAYLKECLHYDPETGIFTWLERPRIHFRSKRVHMWWNSRYSGTRANWVNKDGYIQMRIQRKRWSAHTLAFIYMGQEVPPRPDHINHVRTDNRWSNLRAACIQSNARNISRPRNTKGPMPGVSFRDGFWQTYIGNGNNPKEPKYLGHFRDMFEACCARKSAEARLGYHPNHGLHIEPDKEKIYD